MQHLLNQINLANATMTGILFAVSVGLIVLINNIVKSTPEIEWWHFISASKPDGSHIGDLDKLLKIIVAVIGSWAIINASYAQPPDLPGLALVLAAYFGFGGGVAYGSAKLRSEAASKLLEKTP